MLNCFFSLTSYLKDNTVDVQLFLQPHLLPQNNTVDVQLFLQPHLLPQR